MNKLVPDQSSIRLHRARAARILLDLHAKDELIEPESWTWEALDLIPEWCVCEPAERLRQQRCCGALLLSTPLRLWIDSRLIVAGQSILGTGVFERIAAHHALDDVLPATGSADFISMLSTESDISLEASMRITFEQAGAVVLKSSLPPELSIDALTRLFGENVDRVDFVHAQSVLQTATTILREEDQVNDGKPMPEIADGTNLQADNPLFAEIHLRNESHWSRADESQAETNR